MTKSKKWHLSDWDFTAINTCFDDKGWSVRFLSQGIYEMSGPMNKTWIIFDNGGELNIKGLGFESLNQGASMPLPSDGPYRQTCEEVVAYRLKRWVMDAPIDWFYESGVIDENEMSDVIKYHKRAA